MSKQRLLKHLGEFGVGAGIGGTYEYEKARRGGEDSKGKVISAISGIGKGGIASLLGGAGIRSFKVSRAVSKAKTSPKYTSFVDRLSNVENKLQEKATRVEDWSREQALDRYYQKNKLSGYPQNFDGAMDLLEQKRQDLVAQNQFLKNIGDPSITSDPAAVARKAMETMKRNQMQSDLNTINKVTGDVRKGAQGEFDSLKDERDYFKNKMKDIKKEQNRYLEEAKQSIQERVANKFMGLF